MVKDKSELVKLEDVAFSAQVDLNDVLAIVVSEAETKLSGELAKQKEEMQRVDKALKKNRRAIRDACKVALLDKHGDKIDALNDAMKPFGGTAKLSSADVTYDENENATAINGCVTAEWDEARYHRQSMLPVTTKITKKIKDLLKEAEALEKAKADAERAALSAKRQKANLPMLERQTRAKIASRKLNESEAGRDLLADLTADLDEAIKALPTV